MAAIALDTYAIAKQLRDAGFTEAQAEAVTNVVKQASDVDLSNLATKADIAQLATKAELAEANADLLKWMVGAIGLQTLTVLGGVAALIRLLTPAT